MRKRLLLTFLLLCGCSIAFSQYNSDAWIWPDENQNDALSFHLEVGPKLGAGMCLATKTHLFETKFKNGFSYQAGLSVRMGLKHRLSKTPKGVERIGLGIEALVSGRNIRTGKGNLSMLCLDIPVLLRFSITSNFSLEAGATFVQPLKVNPTVLQMQNIVLNTGNLKPTDVMLSVGANYQIIAGLELGFRCNIGTSPIAENLGTRLNTFMLSADYLFPLLK
jgi:hypothetical protein